MKATSCIPAKLIPTVYDWCHTKPVRLCVLFGSQATGRTHAHSDIDLAIWPTEPQRPLVKLEWLAELEPILKNDVSLVIMTPSIDPVLGFEIIKHGQVIYEAEKGFWLREQSRLWHAYNDSLPFRRATRQKLIERAQRVKNGS